MRRLAAVTEVLLESLHENDKIQNLRVDESAWAVCNGESGGLGDSQGLARTDGDLGRSRAHGGEAGDDRGGGVAVLCRGGSGSGIRVSTSSNKASRDGGGSREHDGGNGEAHFSYWCGLILNREDISCKAVYYRREKKNDSCKCQRM